MKIASFGIDIGRFTFSTAVGVLERGEGVIVHHICLHGYSYRGISRENDTLIQSCAILWVEMVDRHVGCMFLS